MCRYKNIILILRKASHRITQQAYICGGAKACLFSYAQVVQFSLAEFVKEKKKKRVHVRNQNIST